MQDPIPSTPSTPSTPSAGAKLNRGCVQQSSHQRVGLAGLVVVVVVDSALVPPSPPRVRRGVLVVGRAV